MVEDFGKCALSKSVHHVIKYVIEDVLLTIRRVELIGRKEFAVAAFDPEHKAFVVYIAVLNIDSDDEVHPLKRAQIAYLKTNKVSIKVFNKYADFADIFLLKLTVKFLKYMSINDYTVKLVDDQQSPYNLIYSLSPVKLEILRA